MDKSRECVTSGGKCKRESPDVEKQIAGGSEYGRRGR
jgi:hypothetical protein